MTTKSSSQVFGISTEVLPDSYVDRGDLDTELTGLLARDLHVAIRGESKCGKSWIRKKNIPEALIIQCRLGRPASDLYVDAFSQPGIALELERTSDSRLHGKVAARTSFGMQLLTKIGFAFEVEGDAEKGSGSTCRVVGHDVSDLRFVADILRESGKRLVVEDFHYMSVAERTLFAFDLKALWDYKLYVVIVGVWNQSNMLLYLNPDLTGRVREMSIYWSKEDLSRVVEKGSTALNIEFDPKSRDQLIGDCFGNVGILQALVLQALDEMKIYARQNPLRTINDPRVIESAAMAYADQLNSRYQQFAERVSGGIRKRQDTTGIYAHAMAAILEAKDESLLNGLSIDDVFTIAHAREPRIQKGNLKVVLEKFEELQVDSDGRGLVLAYNSATKKVSIVDRQLLLYRKYLTMSWPWEELVTERHTAQ